MAKSIKTIAQGLHFGEGPRWHDGRLWFSDFYAHKICSVGEQGGEIRTELQLENDDQPSGLGWMPDGSLLVVKMQAQQLWRLWPDGRFEQHADLSDYATFWCNDMVVDRQGRAYVGNFGFDSDALRKARGVAALRADHPRTPIALVQADGSVSSAAGQELFSFPNGAVITPDGSTFVVGETYGAKLSAFDIAADGSLANRREWAVTAPRVPDGICLDAEGAIWVANPSAPECVRYAEGGDVLEIVETGDLNCYACMLGGVDGKTLFMVVAPGSERSDRAIKQDGKILSCIVDVAGAGLP